MDSLTVTQERQRLCGELRTVLEHIASRTDKFINTFDQKDFFLFSDEESRRKGYKKEFSFFNLDIADDLLLTDKLMGDASSLLISADVAMEYDSIRILRELLEEYLSFKVNSSEYFSSAEKMLSSQSISVSSLLDGAKKFKFSAVKLMNKSK